MPEDHESRLTNINRTGYLLQLGIEQLVRDALQHDYDLYRWKLVAREHLWRDPATNKDEFIDLVLRSERISIVVECKRTGIDGLQEWYFYQPNPEISVQNNRALFFVARRPAEDEQWGWYDMDLIPQSAESAFCSLRGHADDGGGMLERTAGLLVRSVERLATQEAERGEAKQRAPLLYLPVIVTNARLHVAQFRASDVDLGRLSQ